MWDDDDVNIIMDEAERIGLTRRMGYHAWFVGIGAGGLTSALAFFDDVLECIKTSNSALKSAKTNRNLQVTPSASPKPTSSASVNSDN
jgi:hypothetical protein